MDFKAWKSGRSIGSSDQHRLMTSASSSHGQSYSSSVGRKEGFNGFLTFSIISEKTHKTMAYSKTCVKRPLSTRPGIDFQDQLSLNAGQKYCRMLQWEHSAILTTFIKLPFAIKVFVLSIFEWPFYTDFTV